VVVVQGGQAHEQTTLVSKCKDLHGTFKIASLTRKLKMTINNQLSVHTRSHIVLVFLDHLTEPFNCISASLKVSETRR